MHSTIQACRTDAYISTLYILHTFHRVPLNTMEGGGWSGFQAPLPQRSPPPRWYIITPPFTPVFMLLQLLFSVYVPTHG